MTFLAKILLGFVSVVGSCCAIAVPVSMSADKVSSRVRRGADSGTHQVSEKQGGATGGLLQSDNLGREEQQVVRAKLSFDELWSKIESEYKVKKESEVNSPDLSWKEDFKKIVGSDSGSENTWELIDQEWKKNCRENEYIWESRTGEEIFCGFLLLRNSSVGYRVRATYSENKWKVKVAKKDGNSISYYSNFEKKWNPKEYISFDKLDLKDENTHLWEELSHPLIVKSNKE